VRFNFRYRDGVGGGSRDALPDQERAGLLPGLAGDHAVMKIASSLNKVSASADRMFGGS
jgi:hypothetical protein